MSSAEPLSISIGEHQFRVRASAEEHERFVRAAREANERLNELAGNSGAMSGSRALAMLAFELCLELDELRGEISKFRLGGERISHLIERIDALTGAK